MHACKASILALSLVCWPAQAPGQADLALANGEFELYFQPLFDLATVPASEVIPLIEANANRRAA